MAYGKIMKKVMQGLAKNPKGKKYPGGVESPPVPKVKNPIKVKPKVPAKAGQYQKPAVRSPKGTAAENPLLRMNDAALREFGRTVLK